MILNTTNNLTNNPPSVKNSDEPRVWIELRHPQTHRLIGKYCPQTKQLEVKDANSIGVIQLPAQ